MEELDKLMEKKSRVKDKYAGTESVYLDGKTHVWVRKRAKYTRKSISYVIWEAIREKMKQEEPDSDAQEEADTRIVESGVLSGYGSKY